MRERLVLHNPHALFFKESITSYFAGKKSINKYDYFFDYLYSNNKKIKVLVDDSMLNRFSHGPLNFLKNSTIDFYAWVLLNRLNPFKFKIYKSASKLNHNDLIFTFLYGSFVFDNFILNEDKCKLFNDFKNTRAVKIVHFSHYGYTTQNEIDNIILSKFDIIVSENNLIINSNYFNRLFNSHFKNFILLPFVPNKKFTNINHFINRKNKVLSTGSNTYKMRNKYFIEHFGHDKLQPMRNLLIDNQNKLKNYIDFMTNNLYANELNNSKKISTNILLLFKKKLAYLVGDFYRFLHLLYIYIFNPNINTKKNENEYYKIDIVKKYNEYKMFIVPEEVIDLPAIGFVEGMACGSAYIGLRNSMYKDIGMIDKEHYIGYDGTIEDLIEKISYYQRHDDELRKIANKGYEFVSNNLNVDSIMTNFFNSLQNFTSKSNYI